MQLLQKAVKASPRCDLDLAQAAVRMPVACGWLKLTANPPSCQYLDVLCLHDKLAASKFRLTRDAPS